MNRWLTLGLLLAALGALCLRLPQLDRRPLHADESVHAVKFLGLWERGVYEYDPDEYHGPSLYYVTLPFAWLSRATSAATLRETTLRLVPVAFGVGLILLLLLLHDALGRTATVWAGLFTAVSPAFVYYSRYYIHELLLVFATLLLIGAAWRYLRTRRPGWAALAGLAVGLMATSKETFVLALAALVGAGLLSALPWVRRAGTGEPPFRPPPAAHGLLALGVAALVWVVLFTSFFTNASGPLDSLRTYLPWLTRAKGESPHIHPWHFYLERLAWFHRAKGPAFTEGLILVLGLAGGVLAFLRPAVPGGSGRFGRFLALYTLLLTVVYCLIPYKTPWCVLGFLHGYVLLAGVGAAAVFEWVRPRWAEMAAGLVLTAGLAHLATQAWRCAFPYATDRRNPYVYAHTSRDLLRLTEKIAGIAQAAPKPEALVLKTMAPGGDYWPLPWYLRQFRADQLGWYAEVPREPYADLMIVGAKFHAELDDRSQRKWLMVGYFEHRPTVFFELYVEFELWKKYVATLPRDRDDE